MTTPREIGLLRLVALGLVGAHPSTDPLAAVRRLLAVQAQDLPGALTSVALRTGARDRSAVVAALDAGTVVRSWPMRGTLHLLAAEDLSWLLDLTGPRTVARTAARHRSLDLDERTLAAAGEVAALALADGARLARADLMAAWERAGIATTGQRGYHLVVHLALTGQLCLGPTAPPAPTVPPGPPGPADGAAGRVSTPEQLFVSSAAWLPARPAREREEALADLAWRYLGSHGPATVADLARWSSLPVSEVRRGVAAVRDRLLGVQVDGVELLMDPATPDRLDACRDEAASVLLLPGFDEYLLGYADRDAVLAPEHAGRIVPGRNGVFRPTVVVGGRVVATWRHVLPRQGAPAGVEVDPFDGLAPETLARAGEVHAGLP